LTQTNVPSKKYKAQNAYSSSGYLSGQIPGTAKKKGMVAAKINALFLVAPMFWKGW
jgi:hypothetical protein